MVIVFEYQKLEHLSKFRFCVQNFYHIQQTVIREYKEYNVLIQYEWSRGNPQRVEMATAQHNWYLLSLAQ